MLKHNVSHTCLSDLLKIFKTHGDEVKSLPRDARTLMKTPRCASSFVHNLGHGSYTHFGLAKGIEQNKKAIISLKDPIYKIDINIDGLPISKSSGGQF